jgi:hypothetical protein
LCFIQGFFDNVSKHGPALGYMQWEVPLLSEWLQVGAYWKRTVSRAVLRIHEIFGTDPDAEYL